MAQKRDKTPNNNVTCGFNSVAHKDWSFRMWRRVQGELVANISARFAAPALKRSTIHFLGFPEDEGGTLLHVVIFLNTATFKSVSKSYSMGYVAWRGKAEKSWVRVVNLPGACCFWDSWRSTGGCGGMEVARDQLRETTAQLHSQATQQQTRGIHCILHVSLDPCHYSLLFLSPVVKLHPTP